MALYFQSLCVHVCDYSFSSLHYNCSYRERQKVASNDTSLKVFSILLVKSSNGEIGSHVGRNQTTVMRICDRWMQEVRRTDVADHIRLSATLQNHRRLRHQCCHKRRMWAAEWNEVLFTDESRICLQRHDGRIRVWRQCGERMLNSCVIHQHIGLQPGIMVWGDIGYHTRAHLVRIAGTLNNQRYISEVLKPVVLPYLQGLVTAIFEHYNALSHV
ncbi:transposable element Tcb1 transposase [Trichonephila clavipes]|nr:transposable element Tcb1 transposase [Trichonephila clavipes]